MDESGAAAWTARTTAVVVTLVLLGGCGSPAGPAAVPASTRPTTAARTSTPATAPSASDPGPGPRGVEITRPRPDVAADGPVVVLVHGGAWVTGGPSLMRRWADALAAQGSVVFNVSYDLVGQAGGGYPGSIDDVACAVRFARAVAPAYTASDELVVVGHSAGAHLGAVVSLDPGPWGAGCAHPPAPGPDRFVGLAGVYDVTGWPVALLFDRFVGGSRSERPEAWASVNPVQLADRQRDLDVVLVTAGDDDVVGPRQATEFATALPGGAELVDVPGVGHNGLLDPDVVGLRVVER